MTTEFNPYETQLPPDAPLPYVKLQARVRRLLRLRQIAQESSIGIDYIIGTEKRLVLDAVAEVLAIDDIPESPKPKDLP
jgi:hypothetical protein